MEPLKNIIEFIKFESNKKLEKIKTENLRECEEILKKAKQKAEIEKKNVNKKIAEQEENIENKTKMENLMFESKVLLADKQKLAKKAVEEAFEFLRNEKKEAYFNLFKKLIRENMPNKEFSVEIGCSDYETFKESIHKELSNHVANLTKIECAKNFKHGLKVFCEDYVLSLTQEDLILENDAILTTTALNALFPEN